jgi:hypothetical protein
MQIVLRPTLKYWFNEIIGPVVMVSIPAAIVLALNTTRSLTLVVMGGIAMLLFVRSAILTARTRLEIDALGLRGRLHNQVFDIPWAEVYALRLVQTDRRKPLLQVGGDSGGAQLLLDELDAPAAWRALQRFAPGAALADDAFDRLAWVEEQRAERAAVLAGAFGPVRVRVSAWLATIGWIGVAFFVLVGYLAWRDGAEEVSGFLFLFALLEIYLIYASGAVTEIGPEAIRLTMPLWPTYAMRWDEVQRARMDLGDNQIVLYGAGKRITLPWPAYWRQTDKEAGLAAFFGHLEQRGISFEKTAKAYFALPKGTWVHRSAEYQGVESQ